MDDYNVVMSQNLYVQSPNASVNILQISLSLFSFLVSLLCPGQGVFIEDVFVNTGRLRVLLYTSTITVLCLDIATCNGI